MSLKEKIRVYYVDLATGRKKGAGAALFSFFLFLLSFIYAGSVRLIRLFYQTGIFNSYKFEGLIISVGNITWGGTGKTPLVENLVNFLKQEKHNPAVLIRGYGKDEASMLQRRLPDTPILVGRDRVQLARKAQEQYGTKVIILDDGFQHWRLRRDLDVVLIDAVSGFGNRRLMPAGILREPLANLSRADILVLTKTNLIKDLAPLKKELRRYNSRAPIYAAEHLVGGLRSLTSGQAPSPSSLKARPLALLAGIAAPESFAQSVSSTGAQVRIKFYFSDHYQYRKDDLRMIARQCQAKQITDIITTEKDAVKLAALFTTESLGLNFLVLAIEARLKQQDERALFQLIKNRVDAQKAYSILIISDSKPGHLNQSKALARIIRRKKLESDKSVSQVRSKVVEVKFKNRLSRFLLAVCSIFFSANCRSCLFCLRFCVDKHSFDQLRRSSANIIVSAGSWLASINLLLSYRDNARRVILMKPLVCSVKRFDLAIIPEHDRVKSRNNVLFTRISPNLIDWEYLQQKAQVLKTRYNIQDTRYKNLGPTIGVLVGGDTKNYKITAGIINSLIAQLKICAEKLKCQLLITTSRRTPKMVEGLLKKNLSDYSPCRLLVIANQKNIPEAVGGILGLSDIVLVSGESISMVSEAVSAEKYVLVFMPEGRTGANTKQERFLANLQKEAVVNKVRPEQLFAQILKLWQERPIIKQVKDRQLIYQAIGKIL